MLCSFKTARPFVTCGTVSSRLAWPLRGTANGQVKLCSFDWGAILRAELEKRTQEAPGVHWVPWTSFLTPFGRDLGFYFTMHFGCLCRLQMFYSRANGVFPHHEHFLENTAKSMGHLGVSPCASLKCQTGTCEGNVANQPTNETLPDSQSQPRKRT